MLTLTGARLCTYNYTSHVKKRVPLLNRLVKGISLLYLLVGIRKPEKSCEGTRVCFPPVEDECQSTNTTSFSVVSG
jgi:hypothetical protein